jgi:hypothetical protein
MVSHNILSRVTFVVLPVFFFAGISCSYNGTAIGFLHNEGAPQLRRFRCLSHILDLLEKAFMHAFPQLASIVSLVCAYVFQGNNKRVRRSTFTHYVHTNACKWYTPPRPVLVGLDVCVYVPWVLFVVLVHMLTLSHAVTRAHCQVRCVGYKVE